MAKMYERMNELRIFTQDSLFNAYCTVINEGPAIEVLIVCKAPIWATEFTPLNQTTPEGIAVREDPLRVRTHIVR